MPKSDLHKRFPFGWLRKLLILAQIKILKRPESVMLAAKMLVLRFVGFKALNFDYPGLQGKVNNIISLFLNYYSECLSGQRDCVPPEPECWVEGAPVSTTTS